MGRTPMERGCLTRWPGRRVGWWLVAGALSGGLLPGCGKKAVEVAVQAAPVVSRLLKSDLLQFTTNALVGNVFSKVVFEPLWGLVAPDATAEQLAQIQQTLAEQGAQKLVLPLVSGGVLASNAAAEPEPAAECHPGESDADCLTRFRAVLMADAEKYANGLRDAFLSCRDEAALSPAHAGKEHHQLVEVIERCVSAAGYAQEVAALAALGSQPHAGATK